MTERLTLDLHVPLGTCACCRMELPEGRESLRLDVLADGQPMTVDVCRYCMAERVPETLAQMETEMTDPLDLSDLDRG